MRTPRIVSCSCRLLRAELVTPFAISSGSHKRLENILFSVRSGDGLTGWGEAAVASHVTGESLQDTLRWLRLAGDYLEGKNPADYLSFFCGLEEMLGASRPALAAAEAAVLDLVCRGLGISLWRYFGGAEPRLRTDVTVVIGDAAAAGRFARKMRLRGFAAFKIKVGVDFDEDMRRVEAVAAAAPGCGIYLDANGAYDAREAVKFVSALEKRGIVPEVFEQPVAAEDIAGLGFLSRNIKLPVCADESARSVAGVLRLLKAGAASAINIKLSKFGFLGAREVWSLARARGVKLMAGEMVESELASSAAAQFAGGLGGFDFIDLDIPYFLRGSRMRGAGFISNDGVYHLDKAGAGAGVVPGSGALARALPRR